MYIFTDITNITNIALIVSSSASIAALFVTIVIYRHGLKRETRIDTVETFSKIRLKYLSTIDMPEPQRELYLTELEFFAVGVGCKIYDIRIVAKMSGKRLLSQYNGWMKKWIADKRKEHSNSQNFAYKDVQKMMDTIERII